MHDLEWPGRGLSNMMRVVRGASRFNSLRSSEPGWFTYLLRRALFSSRDSAQEITDPSEVKGHSKCRRRMFILAQVNADGGEAFRPHLRSRAQSLRLSDPQCISRPGIFAFS